MTHRPAPSLTDAQIRDALTRQPDADHLFEELELVVASVHRTRQVGTRTSRWLLLAAAVALLVLLLVLALVGSSRVPPPASRLIAVGVGWDIVLVRADGSQLRHLTEDPETEWEPTWSPDGRRLAYWLEDPIAPSNTCGVCGIAAPRRLVVTDPFVDPLRPTVLTSVSNNTDWRISWSPDSSRLVVEDIENSVRVLAIVDVKTGVLTRLGPATLDGWDPAWSPGGQSVAFAHGRDDPSTRSLDLIDADGTNLRQLTTIPSRGAGFANPAWSPVGDQIAFAAETGGSDPFQKDVWTVGLDGSTEVDRSNDPADEFGPGWSPDGSKLAWLREVTPGASRFHVVVADLTRSAVAVLPQVVSTPPSWSPDGTLVLTVELATGAGPGRLVAIDVHTGAEVVVLEAIPDDMGSWQQASN
jgi:dipeptidyl aminopeptidase/acylaminoacyl peptidase